MVVANQREYVKQYAETNKEILKAKRLTIIECECGMHITKQIRNKHVQSNRHKNNIFKRNDQKIALPDVYNVLFRTCQNPNPFTVNFD